MKYAYIFHVNRLHLKMNFLSHFYHEYPVHEPYYAAGVILPDILSNYSSRNKEIVKIHADKIQIADNSAFILLRAGVKNHYAIDKAFHESDFFFKHTKHISNKIRSKEFSCFEKRLYAFSHVFLEMMLDRIILLQKREVCDTFYHLLNLTDSHKIGAFVSENTGTLHSEKIAEHLKGFCRARFLYDYLYDDVFIQIAESINRRLGNKPFSPSDSTYFKHLIYDLQEELLSENFPKFSTD